MNIQEKQAFQNKFNKQTNRLGKIMLIVAIIVMLSVPFVFGIILNAKPDMGGFLSGFYKVGIIYYPVAIVEFLVYAPMLGTGASYLTFLTGNVTNLKIPCAMNARDIAKTEVGTLENEIISTISVATSSLVTMIVIFIGVLLITPISPILQHPTLEPAFNMVVPALFGALGLKYFLKSFKIAVIPLVTMTLLCIFVPAAISQTSLLLLPAGGIALGIGYLLFKKNML